MTPTTRRRATVLVLLLLLLIGLAAALWQWRAHRQLARVKQLQQELVNAADLTPEQRREKFAALRRATGQLSDSQRQALRAERQRRELDDLRRYAHLSRSEQGHFLDDRINQMEQMRKQWQANGGAAGRGSGGPGGWRNWRSMTPEQREVRRKERLDRGTPELRSLREQFFKDMAARRAQRGLRGGGPRA